jgi:PPM family protein phosphatase
MMHPPASATRLRIEFAQASDPGRDPNKQINEDSCGYAETRFGHLCVLCDGMGGHYGGKEASRAAISTIFEIIEQMPPNVAPAAALKAAIEEAGRRVYRLGGAPENRTRPGSTVVAMVLHDRGVDVAHVGDSRAYVIRANQIYPLTRDHSMVQGMLDAGMLTEAQAIGHPDANKITRALGMKPEVEVEVRPEPMELYPGDVLLMSSDGLTDLVLSADILGCTRQALASGPVEHACKMLVQLANDRGGHDNITIQMVRVTEVGARPLTIAQAPPGTSSTTGNGGPPSVGRPPETIGMTRSEEASLSQRSPGYAPPVHGSSAHAGPAPAPQAPGLAPAPPQAPGPTAPWGTVPPTATDAAPAAVSPTATDAAPAVSPTAADMPAGACPTAADPTAGFNPGLSSAPLGQRPEYRPDSPPLNLPAPTSPGYAPTPPGAPTFNGGSAAYGPESMPIASTIPSTRTSRGGVVFLIVGFSAVIAVILMLVIWSLLPR